MNREAEIESQCKRSQAAESDAGQHEGVVSRAPGTKHNPSVSEALLGLCHGITSAHLTASQTYDVLKLWLVEHISDAELERLSKQDPLWEPFYDKKKSDAVMGFYLEWVFRVGTEASSTAPGRPRFLDPLPGQDWTPTPSAGEA